MIEQLLYLSIPIVYYTHVYYMYYTHRYYYRFSHNSEHTALKYIYFLMISYALINAKIHTEISAKL